MYVKFGMKKNSVLDKDFLFGWTLQSHWHPGNILPLHFITFRVKIQAGLFGRTFQVSSEKEGSVLPEHFTLEDLLQLPQFLNQESLSSLWYLMRHLY